MNYRMEIKAFDTHIEVKISGAVTVTNIIGLQQYLHLDPYYGAVLRGFFDFSEMYVENDDNSGSEVMKMAMQFMKNRPFTKPEKAAYVANDLFVKQYAETYRRILENSFMTLKLFGSKEEAMEWLLEEWGESMKYSMIMESFDTHTYVKFTGIISVMNILGIQQYLHIDPSYARVLRALFDLRDMYINDKHAKSEVMKMAMKYMENRPFEEQSRVAFLASDKKVMELGKIYAGILEDTPIEVRLFDSEIDAA